MRKYQTHDDYLTETLKDPKEAALYLNAAVGENDPAILLVALAQVARAHGLSRMAKRTSISRMGLYKSLSKNGNPEFKTLVKLLAASGLQFFFKPKTLAA